VRSALSLQYAGDHRISCANIIWATPETNTWIRNPSRTQKGELALDIVLEKSVVKKSGDAWRIVLDSCLPVLHLINTTRSIPYAIKQVQELLGVSCAFDTAVQVTCKLFPSALKQSILNRLMCMASFLLYIPLFFNLALMNAILTTCYVDASSTSLRCCDMQYKIIHPIPFYTVT
jgi:hypothetical protein